MDIERRLLIISYVHHNFTFTYNPQVSYLFDKEMAKMTQTFLGCEFCNFDCIFDIKKNITEKNQSNLRYAKIHNRFKNFSPNVDLPALLNTNAFIIMLIMIILTNSKNWRFLFNVLI